LPGPTGGGGVLDGLAGRGHVELHALGHLTTLDCGRRLLDVPQAAVGTGHQVGLVDGHLLLVHFRQGSHHLQGVGAADVGGDLAQVQVDFRGKNCVGIGHGRGLAPGLDVVFGDAIGDPTQVQPHPPLFHETNRDFVHREPAGQGAPLGGHVGDGQAFFHG